jgi:WD40 repeat protein
MPRRHLALFRESDMANLGCTGIPSPGRIVAPGNWLLLLAGAGATICCGDPNQGGPDALPTAQAGQGDYGGPVWSITYSPDNTYLAATAQTRDVWLRDLATGQSSRIQEGLPDAATSLAFSRDGRVLAVAGGGSQVRLWDVETRSELDPLPIGGEQTRSVTFAPEGAVLAVGRLCDSHGNASIALWDYGHRRPLAVLGGHRGPVSALAYSRDGTLLASGDTAGLVKVWDVSCGRERATLQTRWRCVMAMSFSPDGATLATANASGSSVQLWDPASGTLRGELPTASGVFAVSYSPDGKVLVTAESHGIATLWEVSSVRKLGIVRAGGEPFYSLAFSDDGKTFATGGADGIVRLWDVAQALSHPEHPGLKHRGVRLSPRGAAGPVDCGDDRHR